MRFWFLCVLILGCTHVQQIQPVATEPLPTPVAIRIHVDDAFPQNERQMIESAAIALNIQSLGLVTITTVSGMDTASFWVPAGDWRLFRILDGDDITRRFDWRNARGIADPIVGICVRADHSIYLVPDRARTEEQLMSVAMHELLHAVGAEHTGVPTSIMSENVAVKAVLQLTPVDQRELHRALTIR
jgi:hypothetical protein